MGTGFAALQFASTHTHIDCSRHITHSPAVCPAQLPPGIEKKQVVLCDPMLATGGSAKKAIEVRAERAGLRDVDVCLADNFVRNAASLFRR